MTLKNSRRFTRGVLLAVAASLAACGPGMASLEEGYDEDSGEEQSELTGGLTEGSAEALGVLKVANTLDEGSLINAVGLNGTNSRKAAARLVLRRNGPDGVLGTTDDRPFPTLAQLDAVPYVGPAQFQLMLAYARTHGLIAPGVCTYEDMFFDRYGQRFSPSDIALVLSDGRLVRGLENLNLATGFRLVERNSGLAVKGLRLLRPQVFAVVAEKNARAELDALASAINHQRMGSAPADFLSTTTLRLFVQPEWTQTQAMATMKFLVEQIDADIPAVDRAAYRTAATAVLGVLQAHPLPGTVFELRGYTRSGKFEFYPRTPYGWDAALGVQDVVSGKSYWRLAAAVPSCGGCRQRGGLLACDLHKTYDDAQSFCEGRGGNLASSHSRRDDAELTSMFASGAFWLGLEDQDQEGTFAFVDETAVDYLGFQAGEPNDFAGDEDCVEIDGYSNSSGSWNDFSCTAMKPFVCRIP